MKKRRRSIRLTPGDDGDEGAHDRHEAADDEGLVAVPVEEGRRLVEVLLLEDAPVALVERGADAAPDLVADDVAEEGRRAEGDDRDHDVDLHLAAWR